MKAHQARQIFRQHLASGRCVHPASVFDPLSARLAEDAGFEIGMLAGSTASLSVLAAPDLIVLTLTELAQQARRICRAVALPLLVDADHGYGAALNARRTVEELENAGVAALTLEDTLLPAAFGGSGKPSLVSCEEAAGKLLAALDAREDSSLAIVGRTSAPQVTGLPDTLQRLRAYEAAGVDALFVVGVRTWAQLEEIRGAVRLPVILGSAGPELNDMQRLGRLGVALALQGHQPIAAAVQAMQATYRSLRDGTAPAALTGIAPAALLDEVMRADQYDRWVARFSRPA